MLAWYIKSVVNFANCHTRSKDTIMLRACHTQHLQGNQKFQWFQFIWWRWLLQTENRLFLLIDPLSVCWLRQHTFPCIIYISPAATDINSHHLKPNHTPWYNILPGHDCDANDCIISSLTLVLLLFITIFSFPDNCVRCSQIGRCCRLCNSRPVKW